MQFKFFQIVYTYFGGSVDFSELSKIGPLEYSIYVKRLNPNQTCLYEDVNFKWLEWHDRYTYYLIKFNKQGAFLSIEREIWYDYNFPFCRKKIIFDSSIIKNFPFHN